MFKKWYVYMIKCNDGTYYTGITSNLEKRLSAHKNKQGAKYTRRRGAEEVVYKEEYQDSKLARAREIQIKDWSREKKEMLIKGKWSGL